MTRYIVIKQTVEFTSGLFRGKKMERFICCYTDKEKAFYMCNVLRFGSDAKLIKAEVVK
jgi:hypothetical protein